jgi:hypothetical protein
MIGWKISCVLTVEVLTRNSCAVVILPEDAVGSGCLIFISARSLVERCGGGRGRIMQTQPKSFSLGC